MYVPEGRGVKDGRLCRASMRPQKKMSNRAAAFCTELLTVLAESQALLVSFPRKREGGFAFEVQQLA